MGDVGKDLLAIFAGIITLAIVAVIVSKKSQSPQVLEAASTSLARVVSAAVTPLPTTGSPGNLGANAYSTAPFVPGGGSFGGYGANSSYASDGGAQGSW